MPIVLCCISFSFSLALQPPLFTTIVPIPLKMLRNLLICVALSSFCNGALIHRRLWAAKDKPKISGRSFAPAGNSNSKLVYEVKKPNNYAEIVAKAKSKPPVSVEEKGNLDEFLEGGNLGRGATSKKHLYWDNYKMTIAIDEAYSNAARKEIEAAVYTLADTMKCFEFQISKKGYNPPRSKDHLFIQLEGKGCASDLGRKGGRQITKLSENCDFYGTTMHEIMHVLGFYHEHVRFDRDDYIDIDWDLVGSSAAKLHQYKIREDQIHLAAKYDFDSVMHYPAWAGKPISPKKGKVPSGVKPGQRDHLSALDIKRLRALYPCENSPYSSD